MLDITLPEDKSLYFPAFFVLVVIIILAMITVKLFKRFSRKEEERARLIEERLNQMDQAKTK